MRLDSTNRGNVITIYINGQPVTAYPGETIAAVLLTEGRRIFRRTDGGQPRGLFCGMGICYDCLVTVDELPNVRACVTAVAEGMQVEIDQTSEVSKTSEVSSTTNSRSTP
jgi:predicted molibdopterin-dependent oxidoreductase YjgC